MKKLVSTLMAAIFLAALSMLQCSDSDDQDADTIAKELANRLTENLQFENAESKPAPPPEEHAGDPAYPQIVDSEFPDELGFEASFTILVSTDFATPEEVFGAVVYVQGADTYSEIEQDLKPIGTSIPDISTRTMIDGTHVMEIKGKLGFHLTLSGQPFIIDIGLLDNKGEVGNYIQWDLATELVDDPSVYLDGDLLSDGDDGPDGDNTPDGDIMIDGDSSSEFYCPYQEFFDCDDEKAKDFTTMIDTMTACNGDCDEKYDSDQQALENQNCLACCVNELTGHRTAEAIFVQCMACAQYTASPSNISKEDALQQSQTIWESYTYFAKECDPTNAGR